MLKRPLTLSSDGNISPTFRWAFFFLFAGIYCFFKFSFHELWRDEWQAWLMARDMDWGELFRSLYYEGHPALWYIWLKLWTGFKNATGLADELSIQLAHTVVVLTAYAVVLFRWKMSLWLKALLLLGYFPFFEYGMVNRGYAFVMLFGFWSAVLLEKPEKNALQLAGLFFLLCQSEVFGVLMAAALFFYLLQKKAVSGHTGHWLKNDLVIKTAVGLAVGFALFVATVFPREKPESLSKAYTSEPFSIENIGTAFQGNFANTFWIGSIADTNVGGVSLLGIALSLLVLVSLLFLFWGEKIPCQTFLFFLSGFFLFCIAIYPGGVRQWGNLYLFFLLTLQLWLFGKPRLSLVRLAPLGVIIVFQLIYCIRALAKEVAYPFSQAKNAGEFIQQNVPANVPVVAINKFAVAPVTGYANRKFYALPDGELFSYFQWLEKIYLPSEAELKLFAEFKKVGGIVVITDQQLPPTRYPNAQLWKAFNAYNIKNENYFLYALQR